MSAGRPIAIVAVVGVAAAGAILWWRAAERRAARRDAAIAEASRERIRAKGSRDRPSITLDPDLAPLLDPESPAQLDVPEADREALRRYLPPPAPANVFDAAIASIERERAAEAHATQARRGAGTIAAGPGHRASNPNDVELLGLRPRPGVVAPALVPVETGPRDPAKVPPPNSGAPTKPAPSDPEIVEPGLPIAVVRRVIRTAREPIRACYDRELARHPGLEGVLQLTFTIERDGSVVQAAGTGLTPAVATCVAGVVRGLRFPAPDGDGTVTVRYPFPFRPSL